ncbi:MAG TPA: histidine kinase [Thermomicrobiales bacterium]|nr:histidine kinase [Thermomicrobiales bacterium]
MHVESGTSVPYHPELLETLHGRLPQAVAVFDSAQRLIYANARWRSFVTHAHSFTPDSSPEVRFADLLAVAPDLHDAVAAVLTGETVQRTGWAFPTSVGETSWDVTLSPLVAGSVVTGFICLVDEATARVAAERAAVAKARLAAFRADVSQALASSDEIDVVLQACAEAMVRHAPAAFARIWVLEEAEDVYRLRASAGLYTRLDGTYSRIPVDWIREKTFGGHAPNVEINLPQSHRVREPDWAAAQGLISWVNQPLVVRGRKTGFMTLFGHENFTDDTLSELAAVADAIAQFLERKQAEAALRERDALFRDIFEAAVDGLVISDLESGQILAANPAFRAMFGYTQDQLLERSRSDLVTLESRGRLAEHVATISAGQPSRVRLRAVRADGSLFHVAAQGSAILFQGRPALLGMLRDVSEEQAAHDQLEQRVAERTRELQSLLDMSRSISLVPELNPLLDLILDQMRAIVDYESVAIGLIEGDVYTTVAVRRDEIGWQSRNPLGSQFIVDRPQFLWRELGTGRTLHTSNIYSGDEVAVGFRTLVGDRLETTYAHVCSLVVAPLMVGNDLIGAMFLSSITEDRYGPHDIGLVATIANQIAAAIVNARLHERERTMAALQERQRLARELHDSVSQALFGIGLGAETAKTMLTRDPSQAAQPIDYVLQLARGSMAEMRALIFELRPESLAQEGLVAALEKQAAATRARHGIAVELTLCDEPDVPLDVKEAFYRIAQEAMHNTVKHARASTVSVSLSCVAEALALNVTDNGIGFDSGASFPGHLGLVSMRERIARLGGHVTVASAPGEGTTISVSVPARVNRQPSDTPDSGGHNDDTYPAR